VIQDRVRSTTPAATASKLDVRFSVTVRQDKPIRAAIESGRQRQLRLPADWPWADAISTALVAITAVPLRC